MDTGAYSYIGVPLTATVAAQMIVELFDGQVVERRVIVDRVLATHMQRGGAGPRSDIGQIARHALSAFRAEGKAANISTGYWQIGLRSAADTTAPVTIDEALVPVEVEPLPSDVVELGEGPEAVYLYYLPTYRTLAERGGRVTWPCKIGRSAMDPLVRIASQAATALPEPPHMAAVIWTSTSADWERALHGVLAARGRRLHNALGVECSTHPQQSSSTSPCGSNQLYVARGPKPPSAPRTAQPPYVAARRNRSCRCRARGFRRW
jgi:hypothetical protein